MSTLAAILPALLALGTAAGLVQRRGLAGAAADLQMELQRLSEVQLAVAQVRTASAHARAAGRAEAAG
jgi:hypothetical protein